MSQKFPRSLGVILATVLMLVLGSVSPAGAGNNDNGSSSWPPGCVEIPNMTPGDGYTAPAPCMIDVSGVDQDQYCIPSVTFYRPGDGYGMYYVDNKAQDEGCHSTNGASSVVIMTDFDSGTWPPEFTSDVVGTVSKDEYRVVVAKGRCKTSPTQNRYRKVTATFTNVPDEDLPEGVEGRMVHSIYPYVVNLRTRSVAVDVDSATDVRDGETAVMDLKVFDFDLPGLRPGRYRVTFWLSDKGYADVGKDYVGKRMKFIVPKCGKKR